MKRTYICVAIAAALVSTAYADVYKCTVNGKTVYSDARCAYTPGVVRISPNQNVMQGYHAPINNESSEVKLSAKCADLLDRIGHVQSRGALDKYSTLYEFQCMSPEARQASAQKRNDRDTQRKLDDIGNTQRAIQSQQTMHDLYP